jgi:hypothetical protein
MKIDLGIPLTLSEGDCWIDEVDRDKHLFCIGETGSGKTTFFLNLIKNEISNCLIVLDPYGELSLKVASLVPKDRLIYVDKKNPICLNPFDRPFLNRSELSNDLANVINMLVKTINDDQMKMTTQMREILINALKVFDDNNLNFEYLITFLSDKFERKKYHNKSPYWARFDQVLGPGVKNEKLESSQRVSARFSLLYNDENIVPFVKGRNEFNVNQFVKDKKVIVFNFSGFDDFAMSFIGCLVTTFIKSYWQHQAKIGGDSLYYYIDEFHLFITSEFSRFLTGTRKYNISLNFSCHSLSQIDSNLAKIILGCYVVSVLGVNSSDAKIISDEINIDPKKLQSLEKYHAYISINRKAHFALCYPPVDIPDYIPEDTTPLLLFKSDNYNFLQDGWIKF